MGKALEIDWEKVFSEYRASDKGMREFCKDRGIAFSTFNRHFSRYESEKDPQMWLKAELPKLSCENTFAKPSLKINAGKFEITVSECSKDFLSEVIEMVSKVC